MSKRIIKYIRCPFCGSLRRDFEKIKWGNYKLEYVINEIECHGYKGLKNHWYSEEVEEKMRKLVKNTLMKMNNILL